MELFSEPCAALLAQAGFEANYPMPIVMRVFLFAWVAMVGGCIGSFLNVVVYRLPRGRNLSHPGSACPKCGHAIRPWHNIPVFGWLMLRGRCYDCQSPISPRYPLVEATVMVFFVLLASVGPLAAGEAAEISGWHWLPPMGQWLLVAYFAAVLCTLLAFVLIEIDGNPDGNVRYPYSMLVFAMVFGVGEPLVEPLLQLPPPDAFFAYTDYLTEDVMEQVSSRPFSRVTAFVNAAIGGLAGLALGLASRPAWRLGPMRESGGTYAVGSAVLCGIYLGPAALPVLLMSAVLAVPIAWLIGPRLSSQRVPFSIALVPIVLYSVVDWTPTTWICRPYVYPPFDWVGWVLGYSVIILIAAAICRAIVSNQPHERSP